MNEIKKIRLVPLISLDTESQLKVREIRNEEEVRKWMYTDHLIKLNEHLGWINKLKKDNRQIVFVAIDERNEPLGVVSLNAIDNTHKKADWAYYLSKNSRGGLGSALEYAFIDFVFNSLNIDKLNCEVIEGNDTVVKLHKKFLFKDEGFRESNILKKNNRIGIHFLGLTKDLWNSNCESVMDKYGKVLNKFDIEIEYSKSEEYKHPLDEIEEARAKNNLNWMNILRLVLELSPDNGKLLVTDIRDMDKKISNLTDKLIEHEK